MNKEKKELMDFMHKIMWHMRGGLTREDAWNLNPAERDSILEDIKERMATVEETNLPLL